MLFRKMWLPVVVAGFLTCPLLAQDMGERGPRDRGERGERFERGGERGERGERRQFDPQQARQRMLENLKEQLGATDEEWRVLQPKIERVTNAQRSARGGMAGAWGGRGPGGPTGPDAREAESEFAVAARELRTAIQNNAPEQEINQRLQAYRDARKKAEAELQAAREDLRDVLTPRQEAVLVMAGMLE